jgi:oxygen-dependent protoporphyrinogen oxidase
MKPVAIIGAGITGLTAAFYLRSNGIPVTVYESTGRVGGAIQSVRKDGFLAEFGPNTILETSPKVTQLVKDAGLEGRRLDPDPKASARFVVRYQRPIAMPGSPLGFLTTPLFSFGAKLAVLREPFVPRRTDGVEESVAQFVVRRLGQEFLDHAIDALVAGVYAGDPHRLSVPQAFPKLGQLEARYGSLIKGQIFGARDRKKRGEVAKDRAAKFSFDEGLQVLPHTLAEQLGNAVRTLTHVNSLVQTGKGWTLNCHSVGGDYPAEHSAVLYCGTAFRLAEMKLQSLEPVDLTVFSEIRYPPVASVVLGFKREDVRHSCRGFGMLIPRIEGFKTLGTIFSSALFPNRAPEGHLTLTSYVGGERFPELAGVGTERLTEIVMQDLRVILGVKCNPVFCHSVFYPKAIPQYNLGYGKFRAWMTEIETRAQGFFLAGHYRDGISLSDSIVSGVNAADRVGAFVKNQQAKVAGGATA